MALTIAWASGSELPSGARLATYTVTFDASYPTGGETFDVSAWFSGSPDVVGNNADDGYIVQHDRGTAAAGKLLVYESGTADAALDQINSTSDLSAFICKVTVIGNPAIG